MKEIRGKGGKAVAAQADISDPQTFRHMFDSAEAVFGGVDVLVNNAGIMKLSPFAKADDAMFDQMMAINLKGVFNGLREAANRLHAQKALLVEMLGGEGA